MKKADESGYEFTGNENVIIGELAVFMKDVALLLYFSGGMQICFGFYESLSALLAQDVWSKVFGYFIVLFSGFASLLMAHYLSQGSKYFVEIVDTEGRDIALLISALLRLKRLFWILRLVLVGFVVVLVWVIWLGLTEVLDKVLPWIFGG